MTRQSTPSEGLREAAEHVIDAWDHFESKHGLVESLAELRTALARQSAPSEGLRDIVLALRRKDMPDGPCWCSVEPNATNMFHHERRCRSTRAALARQPAPSEGHSHIWRDEELLLNGCPLPHGQSAPSEGLREALEEAIGLALGGGYQHLQARWRRIATEYDRAEQAEEASRG